MFIKKEKSNFLEEQIEKLNKTLTEANIQELSYIIGSKKQIFIRNIMAGISKGIGIGIGFTLITAIIVYLLQKIVKLNLPIISDYIVDIIEIVEKKM